MPACLVRNSYALIFVCLFLLLFRSGTGSAGATIRMYIEAYTADPSLFEKDAQVGLGGLTERWGGWLRGRARAVRWCVGGLWVAWHLDRWVHGREGSKWQLRWSACWCTCHAPQLLGRSPGPSHLPTALLPAHPPRN